MCYICTAYMHYFSDSYCYCELIVYIWSNKSTMKRITVILWHTSLTIVSLLMKLSSVLRNSHSASCWCRWVFDMNYKDREKENVISPSPYNKHTSAVFSVLPTQVFIHCVLLTAFLLTSKCNSLWWSRETVKIYCLLALLFVCV